MKDKYFEIKSTSNSDLKYFKKSPEYYQYYKKNGGEERPHLVFGSALHTLVLEPKKFDRDYYIMDESKRPVPDKNYKTLLNREWKKEQYQIASSKDQSLITTDEHEMIKVMRDKLYASPPAKEKLEYTRNKYEKIIEWKWKGFNCKAKADIVNDVFLADLKTTTNADEFEFQSEIFKFDYYRQGGMYLDGDAGGNINFNQKKDFYFIAIEKKQPFGVSVHKLSNDVVEYGVREYRSLVEQLATCYKTKQWPGYEYKAVGNFDGSFEVNLPFYLKD